jgi:hypothetical protein
LGAASAGEIFEQEFQLQPHPLTYHRAVLIEAHGLGLTEVNLDTDLPFDQTR